MGGAWRTLLGDASPQLEMVDLSKLLPRLRLVYTNTQRTSPEIAIKQTRDTEEEDKTVLDSLALTKKLGLEIEECLKENKLDRIGDIFNTHWLNKQRRSDLISSPELDSLYGKAMRDGATGGKLLGLGGGGYFLFYVPDQLLGFETIPFEIDWDGGKVVYTNGS